tara:strand:+ start:449 stop:1480 length:1032 start_codon:yes stop_codon:yes gene_type:complete
MNQFVEKYSKFLYFFENVRSDYLGFSFSFFLHFAILLFAIGIPNFFEPKPIYIPTIIPIEIINVSETTSIPKEVKDIKPSESKQVQIKEKKFNSSETQEIKKIEIKDKPKVENIEDEKKINIKENVQIKEKKTIPNEIIKKKIELETSNFESLPTEKIKPKLKPKIEPKIMENNTKTDVSIEAKPKPKPEPEFDIASMLKDLRNEKTTPKVDNINEEEKKDIIKKETQEVVEEKGAELSISEIDLVLQQLSRCFIAPAGAEINKSMYVKISAKIQRNRRVLENSIRIVDTNISKSSTVYGPITESAMRTLLNPDCIPLKLPEDKYELWKNLTMKFDYSIMRGN